MADISKLSDAELLAIIGQGEAEKKRDITDLSDEELQAIIGTPKKQAVIEAPKKEVSTLTKYADKASRLYSGLVEEPLMGVMQSLTHNLPQEGLEFPGPKGTKISVGGGSAAQMDEAIKQAEATKKQKQEAAGNEGYDLAGLFGNVLSPLGLRQAAPKILEKATTLGGKLAQGVAVGATAGGAQTVKEGDYDTAKLEQIGTGALLGALLPGGVEIAKGAGRIAKRLLQPVSEVGRAEILRDYLGKLVGPAKEKVVEALRKAEEFVPGSKPTAGEAVAEVPEATALAAYQANLAKTAGGPKALSPMFAAREAEQEAARSGALGTVAKTKEELAEAVKTRTANAAVNYGKAYDQAIKADPVLAQMGTNPYFKEALPDALKLAESKGLDSKQDLTKVLHYVKISLDKMMTRSGDKALDTTEKAAVKEVRDGLVDWVGKKNPAYENARAEFAKESVPINQMEVGQYLKDKLVSNLDKERAGSFAEAVRNAPATIKKASGQTMFKDLGQVLTKEQTSTVDNVLADLQRADKFRKSAEKTTLAGAGKLAEEGGVSPPQLLSREVAITNFMMKLFKHGADDKIQATAADLMLQPKKLADFLTAVDKVSPGKVEQVQEIILKRLPDSMKPRMQKIFDTNPRILAVRMASTASGDKAGE